jgi:BirA family biotin operon repressor/biotin-[acetyl-CoA-carboxylase] ligase
MRPPALISRVERFERVGSTQEIVRGWLADGVPEVCLAVADVQTAGRGRLERRWQALPGRALMVSAGFRPIDLPMTRAWRLPAVVALSMLEARESLLASADVGSSRLALKWPNDIVVVRGGLVRKLGGVLSEGIAEGDRLGAAIVGVGVNVDWPAAEFPAELADSMWSLREVAAGAVDREALLAAWLERLAPRYEALRGGRFDGAAWSAVQVTSGADIEVDRGGERVSGRGFGVDPESGALLLEVDDGMTRVLSVAWGEVVSCRVGRVPGHL